MEESDTSPTCLRSLCSSALTLWAPRFDRDELWFTVHDHQCIRCYLTPDFLFNLILMLVPAPIQKRFWEVKAWVEKVKHKFIYSLHCFCPVHKNKQDVMDGTIPTNDDGAEQKVKQPMMEVDKWHCHSASPWMQEGWGASAGHMQPLLRARVSLGDEDGLSQIWRRQLEELVRYGAWLW